MVFKPRKHIKIKKIDAIIVIILLVIAGFVLTQAGYITPTIEQALPPILDREEPKDDEVRYFRINKQFRAIGEFDENGNFLVLAIDNHQ